MSEDVSWHISARMLRDAIGEDIILTRLALLAVVTDLDPAEVGELAHYIRRIRTLRSQLSERLQEGHD